MYRNVFNMTELKEKPRLWFTIYCMVGLIFTIGPTNIECCGGIMTSTIGTIVSDNFPNQYPLENRTCTWTVLGQPGTALRLRFTAFHMESKPCTKDFVEVHKDVESTEVVRFCGSTLPPPITTNGNVLVLTFQTNDQDSYDGFSAEYESIHRTSLQLVGGKSNTSGLLQVSLTNNKWGTVCSETWDDSCDEEDRFKNLSILPPCPNSWDGLAADVACRLLFGFEYTGTLIPSDSFPTADRGEILLDDVRCYGGEPYLFRCRHDGIGIFSSNCNERTQRDVALECERNDGTCVTKYSANVGTFASPRYPIPYVDVKDCSWFITVLDVNKKIELRFSDFHTDENKCLSNNIEVRDGLERTSPLLKLLCGTIRPDPITSTGNTLSIRLKSTSYTTGNRFRASWTAV